MKMIWGFIALDMIAFTAYVFFNQGSITGLVDYLGGMGLWSMQVFIDLILALVIASVFIVRDAKVKGVNPWPYVVGCLFTGSISLLIYMVLHGFHGAADRQYASE